MQKSALRLRLSALRGTAPDTNQTIPIGLNGGRFAEALKALIHSEDDEVYFGNLYMDDVLDMIDHALNPRLAKKMTEVFCGQILQQGKHVF